MITDAVSQIWKHPDFLSFWIIIVCFLLESVILILKTKLVHSNGRLYDL